MDTIHKLNYENMRPEQITADAKNASKFKKINSTGKISAFANNFQTIKLKCKHFIEQMDMQYTFI